MNNYRPISLLSCISKIIERIIYNNLLEYLKKFDILTDRQFGFRPKHSTVDAIAELTERIRLMLDTKSSVPLTSYLDLKKAFDTVNHKKLLSKLESYGIRGPLLSLFKSYLSDRKQLVQVYNVQSEVKDVQCGVPQGSVLGPLLFLLYINDLHQHCKLAEVFHFADNTSLLFPLSANLTDAQKELDVVNKWLQSNKLTLNLSKTELQCTQSIQDALLMQGNELKLVEVAKYLGLYIDSKLSFKDHVAHLITRLSKLIGLSFVMRKYLKTSVLLKFYDCYIKSVIQYGLLIYGSCSKSILMPLKRLQKKFLRCISYTPARESAEHLFEKYNILPVHKLYIYDLIKFSLKSYNNLHSSEILNSFCVESRSNYNTRSTNIGLCKIPKF